MQPDVIAAPPLCEWHQHDLLVHRVRIPESGPWQLALVAANILLFTWSTTEQSVQNRLGKEGEPTDLTLILGEIGCLACAFGEGYDRVSILIRRDLEGAMRIALGKATDPLWPIHERAEALR